MSLDLQNVALTLPSGTEFPGTPQGLLDLIAQYLAITGGESFSGINIGPTEPSADNRDLPWFKTDGSGNPIGWFAWNGSSWSAFPVIAPSGTTASRPASPTTGQLYLDTDIDVLLVYERAQWRTVSGSPGDIKFVTAASEAAALTQNPGWSIYTAGAGRVLGVQGSGAGLTTRTIGEEVGSEEVILTDTQLPTTSITLTNLKAYSGQHQNGSQPAGVYPYVTGTGDTTINDAFGSDEGHDNMQPTLFVCALVKD